MIFRFRLNVYSIFKQISLIFFLCGITAKSAMAFQQVDIEPLLKDLQIVDSTFAERLYTQKVMPYDTRHSIVLLPIGKPDYDVGVMEFDVHLLIVNNLNGEIRSKAFFENLYYSDAVILEGFTIDTAPYQLNKDTRAFGIRSGHYTRSRPNPYEADALTLFIEEEGSIRPVLHSFTVERSNGENNQGYQGVYNSETIKRNTLLIMDKAQTNGYYDIRTRTKVNVIETRNDKVVKDSTYRVFGLLQFNGTLYEAVKIKKEH